MRLLTNQEEAVVAGGHIDGQDDPFSLNGNGNGNRVDYCAKISSRRVRDKCYLETQRS